MKRRIAVLALLALLLSGCAVKGLPETYQFPNKDRTIESIELFYNPYVAEGYTGKAFTSIRILRPEEIVSFMDRIYSIQTAKCITPPRSNYGEYIAEVTYENGDIERFSSWHIELIEKGETSYGVGAYFFLNQEDFDNLFIEYAGISDFSEFTGQGDGSPVP